jgi:hypothetical protein
MSQTPITDSIEEHYKLRTDLLRLFVGCRDVYVELQSLDKSSLEYKDLLALYNDECGFVKYKGALLVK